MDQTLGVTQLGYIGLSVSDLRAWEEFATEILGLAVSAPAKDGWLRLRMDDRHYRILLREGDEDDLALAGWEVRDETSLTAFTDHLRSNGVEVREGTKAEAAERQVLGLINFHDPADLPTEIFYGPLVDKKNIFRSPRPISSFVTGEAGGMGVGHIVLSVPNLDDGIRFYRDVLGFRVSDYIDLKTRNQERRLAFFHCNQRHHSIALAGLLDPRSAASTGATLNPSSKRLTHFMVEVEDMDDVGITHGLCKQRGIPTTGLGRHSNDRMFSFYAETPSGFQVEFGNNGRLVDDSSWEVQFYESGSIWGHERPRPS